MSWMLQLKLHRTRYAGVVRLCASVRLISLLLCCTLPAAAVRSPVMHRMLGCCVNSTNDGAASFCASNVTVTQICDTINQHTLVLRPVSGLFSVCCMCELHFEMHYITCDITVQYDWNTIGMYAGHSKTDACCLFGCPCRVCAWHWGPASRSCQPMTSLVKRPNMAVTWPS